MEARLVPVYFEPGRDADFDIQLAILQSLPVDKVEFLAPVSLGNPLPEVDAVVFPQFLGEAYRQVENFKKIDIPILIITSEFGTLSMWDWEWVSCPSHSPTLSSHHYLLMTGHNLADIELLAKVLDLTVEVN